MKHRLALIFPGYAALFAVCLVIAFLLRFDFEVPEDYWRVCFCVTPLVLMIKLAVSWKTGEWQRSFRYVSVVDLLHLGGATVISTVCVACLWFLPDTSFHPPRSVIVIDALLSFLAAASLRMGFRSYHEILLPRLKSGDRSPALIYGTGESSIGILRMLTATQGGEQTFRVVGFVSESAKPSHNLLAGLPVLGAALDWPTIQRRTSASHLLIPGGIPGKAVRDLLHECAAVSLKVHVIPGVDELVDGRFKLTIRDVTVSDLLRREPNVLDMEAIKSYVTGRRVIVTGGAGSIGSELVRQLLALAPQKLIVYDQSEFGVFALEQELLEHGLTSETARFVVADVLDTVTLDRIMTEERPHLIFHAAAYKHVPLMEDNPQAAVMNNIFGTRAVADAAHRHKVERMVLISTDKAVRPSSVMGASKLLAEKVVQSLAKVSQTRYITVRFGNVLNSMGSVVPTFRKQIEAGGPVTVTHPDMQRFFMTIPEAVQLVIQAGAVGTSGDVLILDMGEPVKIVDLARDLIVLSGLRCPEDIEIAFTGMRPGEKLTEELFYASELGAKKVHEKIFCGDSEQAPSAVRLIADLEHLHDAAEGDTQATLLALKEVVANYSDATWTPARLRAAA